MARVIRRLSEIIAQRRVRQSLREDERRSVDGRNGEDVGTTTDSNEQNQDAENREGEAGADEEAVGPRTAVA